MTGRFANFILHRNHHRMKKSLLTGVAFILLINAEAQVWKRLSERARQKLENKAGDKVDKGIDNATDVSKKDKKASDSGSGSSSSDKSSSTDKSASSGSNSSDDKNVADNAKPSPPDLKTYTKYDFVPGEKLLVYENFSSDAIGDFPSKWNTNSSGEMVTIDGHEGKWLKLNREGIYYPEFITSLPDNFTMEFDLGTNNTFNYYSTEFFTTFANLEKPEDYSKFGRFPSFNGKHMVRFSLHPHDAANKFGQSDILTTIDGSDIIRNHVAVAEFIYNTKNVSHISIWRQNQRLRVYVNNEKIWDLPKAFAADSKYNSVVFATADFNKQEDFYVISNVRLAVGAPDTRNKLITEGKFTTHGILFDVNSDRIRPESYGTMKDIANVLTENASVKVIVIGHTDSDGDDKSNLDLSRRRAESVKTALVKDFGLEGSRIQTDGKGETQPVDKGDTPIAKANNRRVEFVKL
jgi:OOP family OmpA-OmpF porin